VNITQSSFNGFLARNAADLVADTESGPLNRPNQWLSYGFGLEGNPGSCHPKNWVIEISDSGSDWREIDRRKNNNELNAENVGSEACHFIRLRQTGVDHYGIHSLFLSSFEIFGDFFESNSSSHIK
jgi:hypothetical protein